MLYICICPLLLAVCLCVCSVFSGAATSDRLWHNITGWDYPVNVCWSKSSGRWHAASQASQQWRRQPQSQLIQKTAHGRSHECTSTAGEQILLCWTSVWLDKFFLLELLHISCFHRFSPCHSHNVTDRNRDNEQVHTSNITEHKLGLHEVNCYKFYFVYTDFSLRNYISVDYCGDRDGEFLSVTCMFGRWQHCYSLIAVIFGFI